MFWTRSRRCTASAALSLPPERLRMWRTLAGSSGQERLGAGEVVIFILLLPFGCGQLQFRPECPDCCGKPPASVTGEDFGDFCLDEVYRVLFEAIPIDKVVELCSVGTGEGDAAGVSIQLVFASESVRGFYSTESGGGKF